MMAERTSERHLAPAPRLKARQLVAAAIWLGLAYGLVEGISYSLLRLIPWAASPLNGTTLDILWIAPLEYAAAFGLIGVVFGTAALASPRIRWDVPLAALLVGLAAFLIVDIQDHLLANYASVALGAGVAVQVARWYSRRADHWLARMLATLPLLSGAVLLLAAIVIGGARLVEAAMLPAAAPDGVVRPNVLLLVIDTQRADHLSAYGYHRPTTPRLDQLAREGVLFERAHAPSSWTLPSHASMMTGRTPREHRAGDPFQPFLDGRYPTLAEVLRDAGYATGGFVSNAYWAGRQVGLARGFTRYEDHLITFADALFKPVIGRRLAWDAAPQFGITRLPSRPRADVINGRLLTWIDRVGPRPFFAFVNYMDVHGPYLGPPPYDTMFASTTATPATEYELAPTNDAAAARMQAKLRESLDAYDGSLVYLDSEIGRLLDALEERNLANDTLVIVTSDHGESFGEHGLVNHGNSVYLHQTHVPLIMRFPGRLGAGGRNQQPTSLTQLGHTILSLIGQQHQAFTGSSFFAADRHADAVLTEVAQRRQVPQRWPTSRGWLRSLVTERWHFILNEAGEKELYDLENDRGEEHNQADNVAVTAVVTKLHGELLEMMRTGTRSNRPVDLTVRRRR